MYPQIYIIVDRDNRSRILAVFDNRETAESFAYEANGVWFERYLHSVEPEYKGYNK